MTKSVRHRSDTATRPPRLEGAAMNFAPVNELGVVLLFAQVAKRHRIRIDHIQAAFPDCIAYRTVGGKDKRLRIEFEYRSKHFVPHGHNPRQCDMIVCWEARLGALPAADPGTGAAARVRARVQRLDPAGERGVREGSCGR